MEYIYGPPPPPPSSNKAQGQENKNQGQNKRKHQGNNSNNNNNTITTNNNNKKNISHNNPKKPKLNESNGNYLDLPTHLPNHLPGTIPMQSNDDKSNAGQQGNDLNNEQQLDDHDEADTGKTKEVVPVFGTNIVLKTEEDIQKWIQERKANWMKKISNSRPEPEPKTPHEKPERNIRDNNQRANRQNQRSNNAHNNQNHNQNQRNNQIAHQRKTNLNRLIIQRDIQNENIAILDVIKELFDQNILTNE